MVLLDIPQLDYNPAEDWLPVAEPVLRVRLRSADELLAIVTDPRTWAREAQNLPADEFGTAMRDAIRNIDADDLL